MLHERITFLVALELRSEAFFFLRWIRRTKYILPGGANRLLELLLPSASMVSSGVGVEVGLEDDAANINGCKQKQPRNIYINQLSCTGNSICELHCNQVIFH